MCIKKQLRLRRQRGWLSRAAVSIMPVSGNTEEIIGEVNPEPSAVMGTVKVVFSSFSEEEMSIPQKCCVGKVLGFEKHNLLKSVLATFSKLKICVLV